jgi:prophage regulatory protein
MRDMLEQPVLDPGSRNFGELVQERVWALHEIRRLRSELAKLRDSLARPTRTTAERSRETSQSNSLADNPRRLIRLNELKQMIGVSRSTIYLMLKDGRFPQPVRFGRTTAWRMADVIAWQEALHS